jgi:hypothetical protein
MLGELCSPSLLYLAFSLIQIIIDIIKNMYNTALLKFIFMIVFTLLLNILCQSGLTIISWILVFVPFIMMTVITSLLLYVFGLSPYKGTLTYSNKNTNHINESSTTEKYKRDYNSNNIPTSTSLTNDIYKSISNSNQILPLSNFSKISDMNNDLTNVLNTNTLNNINVDPSRLQQNTRYINNITIDDVSKISKFPKFPNLPSYV